MAAWRGIAGGIISGVTYFGTDVGSNDPPGIAAARALGSRNLSGESTEAAPPGTSSAAPVIALALRSWRRVSMTPSF